jgi:hypothetical protein
MSRTRSHPRIPSQAAAEAIGRFVQLVDALDQGQLRQAGREQVELRRLGFDVTVRPLGSPLHIGGGEPC